jgi:hypothetical protein
MRTENEDFAEMEFLKQQLELEQTNYKTAVSLNINFIILKAMREKIKLLTNTLQLITNKVERT